MLKYDLLKHENSIYRVLEIQEEKVLMIDCLKQTMPVWIRKKLLVGSEPCSMEELQSITGVYPMTIDSLSAEQKKVMYQRHSLIVPVLPYLSDEKARSNMIRTIAMERKISKQTIRKYLCQYLSYMDMTVLAPKLKSESRFYGKDLAQVQDIQEGQKAIVKGCVNDKLQAQISLSQHIETIVHSSAGTSDVNVKSIHNTRKRERNRLHKDYMKEENHD